MFFKKHKGKGKKNKGKKFTSNAYKSGAISHLQMMAISESVINKRRLLVFAESM